MTFRTIVTWALRIMVGAALVGFGLLKLIGDPMAAQTFKTLGAEPWLRYITGLLEFGSGALLLFPMTGRYGALAALAPLTGAMLSHVFILGLGFPFPLAVLLAAACVVILALLGGLPGLRQAKS